MSMLMQRLRVEDHRHAALARLTLVLVTQQVLVSDDIGPVVTTRIVHTEQNLTEPGQPCQRLERLCRQ